MNDKRNDRKLDIIDKIDEEIIDRNTRKRISLMRGRKNTFKKKAVISAISAVACLALIVSALFIFIRPDERQIPIYQGMTVSDTAPTLEALSAEYPTVYLTDSNNGNNGNHYGNNKKPIKDIVDDSLKVEGASEDIYYAKPNQEVYITVKLSNPDNFTILSFVLNGKTYASYMFEEGSDMENLILKYDVGAAEGVVDYTIDAVKYVDGTEIKDCIMEGDRTVKVGVYSDKQPLPTVKTEVIGTNSLYLGFGYIDPLSLLSFSGGKSYVALFDGESLVEKKEISVGNELSAEFKGLKTATEYRYAFIAQYDALDGEGYTNHVLYEREFITEAVVNISDITVDYESISFSVGWNSLAGEKKNLSIELYKGEEKVKSLDPTATTADGLYTDTAYTLVVKYLNPVTGMEESVTSSFTTKKRTAPTLVVGNFSVGFDSFYGEYILNDEDNVTVSEKTEVYNSAGVACRFDTRSFVATSLLSDTEYNVIITVVYNLNDGTGDKAITLEKTVKTKAKSLPTLTLGSVSVGYDRIEGSYTLEDPDGVIVSKVAELYLGDSLVKTLPTGSLSAEGLLSDTAYTLKVSVVYDLDNGEGEKNLLIERTVTTKRKQPPTATLSVSATPFSLSGSYTLSDTDNVTKSVKVTVKQGAALVAEFDTDSFTKNGLQSYTDYEVAVTVTYDLNNGEGEKTAEFKKNVKTQPDVGLSAITRYGNSAIMPGDDVVLSLSLINNDNASITAVIIGGVSYTVDMFSHITINSDALAVGDNLITVDRVTVTKDGITYNVAVTANNSFTIHVNGEIRMTSYSVVNENGEKIVWAFPGEKVYLLLNFPDDDGFDITEVKIKYSGGYQYNMSSGEYFSAPEKLEDGVYRVEITSLLVSDYMLMVYPDTFTFTDGSVSDTRSCGVFDHRDFNKNISPLAIHLLKSAEKRYVSSPSDILNMEDGYYYELSGDISFAGVDMCASEWQNNDFRGVLNGAGYKITGISYIDDGTGAAPDHISLFRKTKGVFANMKLEFKCVSPRLNLFSAISIGSYDVSDEYESMYGTYIYNCEIMESSDIRCNEVYLFAKVDDCLWVENCVNNADVQIFSSFAGSGMDGYVINCTNNGNLSGEYSVNLFGSCLAFGCFNNGDVYAKVFDLGSNTFDCVNNGELITT